MHFCLGKSQDILRFLSSVRKSVLRIRIRIRLDSFITADPDKFHEIMKRIRKRVRVFFSQGSLFCLIHMNNKLKNNNQNHSWVLYFMIEVGSGSRAGTVISRKGSGSWSNWNGSVTLPEMEGIRVGLKRIIMYYIRYIWYICKFTVLLFAQV